MKLKLKAKLILRRWIERCRERNESGKVELKDVSNWAEKRLEISGDCPSLDSVDGIFLLFCLGSLLSFGGGPYQGRVSELRNKYEALILRRYYRDKRGEPFSDQRKRMFAAIDERLQDLRQRFGAKKPLQNWWNHKKKQFNNNLERAAEGMLKEIHSWTYPWPEGKKSPLFTVKTFWIPRELHANGIWPDFPVKYCCVPDSRVKDALKDIYGRKKFKELFNVGYDNHRFDLHSSILMSKKVWELVSKEEIDGHYPYDMPLFARDSTRHVAEKETIPELKRERKKLPTWGGRSSFSYVGSVETGTRITYGSGFVTNVSAVQYQKLLNHFKGKRVPCGTSRTKPPRGSLGEWLMENVTKTAAASYVGRILVWEGYAIKLGSDIQFK